MSIRWNNNDTKTITHSEDALNIEASVRLCKLHDLLTASGYPAHALEVLLGRLFFCLFAENTGILNKAQLHTYLNDQTGEDGADLGIHLDQLFQVLNTPQECRQANVDQQLGQFPYVPGSIFAEPLPLMSFDRDVRAILLHCCALDWGQVSPAIIGSLFQSIIFKPEHRYSGAHYLRKDSIAKLLRPFLPDELLTILEQGELGLDQQAGLDQTHQANGVFEPTCGSGNFLLTAHEELRGVAL